jgi:hypothetical protein
VSPTWPHGDPRDVARAILAEPRFRGVSSDTAGPTWWDRLVEWFDKLMRALFGPLVDKHGDLLTVIGVVVAVALLLGVVVVLVLLLERFAPGLRGAGRARVPEARALSEEQDAATLRARARAAATAGRFREAAALLWAAALRALDERGRVRFDAARSPSEWRRAVRDPAFDELARDAVVALFGERAPDAAVLARMDAAYDVLLVR